MRELRSMRLRRDSVVKKVSSLKYPPRNFKYFQFLMSNAKIIVYVDATKTRLGGEKGQGVKISS